LFYRAIGLATEGSARELLIVVYSVDVLTSMPAGLLCVFKLKLQLEKTSGAAKASIRIKSFFMAFNFAVR
jgi:hypothetical protein